MSPSPNPHKHQRILGSNLILPTQWLGKNEWTNFQKAGNVEAPRAVRDKRGEGLSTHLAPGVSEVCLPLLTACLLCQEALFKCSG